MVALYADAKASDVAYFDMNLCGLQMLPMDRIPSRWILLNRSLLNEAFLNGPLQSKAFLNRTFLNRSSVPLGSGGADLHTLSRSPFAKGWCRNKTESHQCDFVQFRLFDPTPGDFMKYEPPEAWIS